MDETVISKAEARKRHRIELAAKGIKLGLRKPRSAKSKFGDEDRRQGICLVCHKKAHECECSGHMSEAAQNRFFDERDR